MAKFNQEEVDELIAAASKQGDREGNDAQIEVLQSLLGAACDLMTEDQWSLFIGSETCTALLSAV